MQKRWDGFTIVELIICIVIVAILVSITVVSYNSVRRDALLRAAQSDLSTAAPEMTRAYQKTGAYPTSLSGIITPSDTKITLDLVQSGTAPYYSNLTAVQTGTLLATICSSLITEGVGKGVDQGGTTRDYVTGCGNWNHGSMQVTGWETRVWNTPVTKEQLTQYADAYTVSNTFHKSAQETAVKNFYRRMAARLEQQGARFPVTSFWDYWATPTNGGVMQEALPAHPQMRPYYCIQASVQTMTEVWHITEEARVTPGGC